jgi:hypothetical protein
MSVYANPFGFFSPFDPTQSLDLNNVYYQDNPDVAYQYALNKAGLGGPDNPFGRYLQGQYNTIHRNYLADAPSLPTGTPFLNYLGQHGGDYAYQFRQLSPELRGERQQTYQPRVRYSGF